MPKSAKSMASGLSPKVFVGKEKILELDGCREAAGEKQNFNPEEGATCSMDVEAPERGGSLKDFIRYQMQQNQF